MASQRRSRSSRHAKGGVIDRHGRRYRDWAQDLPHFGDRSFWASLASREHFEPLSCCFPMVVQFPDGREDLVNIETAASRVHHWAWPEPA
jgi:hypothetical protein